MQCKEEKLRKTKDEKFMKSWIETLMKPKDEDDYIVLTNDGDLVSLLRVGASSHTAKVVDSEPVDLARDSYPRACRQLGRALQNHVSVERPRRHRRIEYLRVEVHPVDHVVANRYSLW